MERLIVCDIDGTILENLKRKQQCIREASGKSIGLGELAKKYEINRFLTMGEYGRFAKLFFSGKYLALDTPIPGAARALNHLLHKGYLIVYLTGRHHSPQNPEQSMRKETLDWLAHNNFPQPGEGAEIIMKPGSEQGDEEFKRNIISRIREMGFAIAGIGDLPSDALAYSRLGGTPLIFRRVYNKDQKMPPGTIMVDKWEEVLEWVERNG